MCECVKKFNRELEVRNGRIVCATAVTKKLDVQEYVCIQAEKIDSKKKTKLPTLVASFCPFCGEKQR